jgi:hypothetical protein
VSGAIGATGRRRASSRWYTAAMTALLDLQRRLAAVPDSPPPPAAAIAPGIADSVRYLASDAAQRSLDADVYWPKWSGPWWHMLLLHEMGEARQIPERASARLVERLQAFPIKIFPVWPGELPPGTDPHRHTTCHCALGSVAQVLAACGRDVDRELPWFEPWFVRYQMADGGLSCDDAAYRVADECPSSMVGTVAPLEAMLLGRPADWSSERAAFVERAAGFLIGRRLLLGSSTRHNAEERDGEALWLAPCFPRFYLYDALRGLAALVRWAEVTGSALPMSAIAGAIDHLLETCPDGWVRRARRSYADVGTWMEAPSAPPGTWVRHRPAFRSPLLDAASALGEPCPHLTRQWSATRRVLVDLIGAGRVNAEA